MRMRHAGLFIIYLLRRSFSRRKKEARFITFAYRPKTVVKTLRAVSMQSPSAVAG